MFTSSVIDPVEFESERGVILEELAMADDDPSDVVSERFFEAVFGDDALGRPIGGSPASIGAVGRTAVWDHYRANYRPQDLVVTVAGAVDHDVLVAAIVSALERADWDLGVVGSPVPRRQAATSGHVASAGAIVGGGIGRTVIVNRPTEQANLLIGVPGLAASDARRPAVTVLNSVLGGGMSSRLFQEVREKRGLAYSVYSFAAGFSDAGVMGLYAGCSPKRAADVAELMLGEFRRLADDGITEEELSRAQGQLGGGAALALEDSDARMSRLGRSELTFGEFSDLDETLRRISAVTRAQVQELAQELVARPLSVAAVGALKKSVFDGLAAGPSASSESAA
jgi:predicted Zn-dependent peptidase